MNSDVILYSTQKALEGKSILILFPNEYLLNKTFRSDIGNEVEKVISQKTWRFPKSEGRILFRTVNIDINSLRGMEIEVQFAEDSDKLVSEEILSFAHYRSSRNK
jgi:hypothetical protein